MADCVGRRGESSPGVPTAADTVTCVPLLALPSPKSHETRGPFFLFRVGSFHSSAEFSRVVFSMPCLIAMPLSGRDRSPKGGRTKKHPRRRFKQKILRVVGQDRVDAPSNASACADMASPCGDRVSRRSQTSYIIKKRKSSADPPATQHSGKTRNKNIRHNIWEDKKRKRQRTRLAFAKIISTS